MNLLWRDNFESFLDVSAPDASSYSTTFANTVGPDTGFPSNQPLLWIGSDPAPSAGADVNTISFGDFDAGTAGLPSLGSGLVGQDMLWAEPRSAATWPLADNAGDPGATTLGIPRLPLSTDSMPSDVGSLVWETTLFRFERVSAIVHSSALDSALNQALDLVWTATGGTGAPPVTLPHAPTNPFLDGFPASLPQSPLVWPGEPPTNVVPDAAGQPPITPPAAENSLLTGSLPEPSFATLASQQLVWIDPSTGAPTLFNDQSTAVLTQLNPLFSRA